MRDATDFVVSVPPRELEAIRPPGSVFGAQTVATAPISRELRLALSLFGPDENLRFVARPEIFTHGDSLEWLRGKIAPARRHLALSDGTAIPLIPGLANHVFFYGAGRRADCGALAALETRVPELFAQLQGQINAAFRFGERRCAPDSFVWPGRDSAPGSDARLLRFYSHPHSLEESVARTLHWGEVRAAERGFSHLLYVALTETSLDDSDFIRGVAGEVARAYFKPEIGILLRLPLMAQAVEATLRALRGVDAPIPGVPSANVYLALDDAPRAQLAALAPTQALFTHDSFDFWRHGADYYAGFAFLEVAARRRRHAPGALPVVIAELTGREATLVWPRAAARADWGPL